MPGCRQGKARQSERHKNIAVCFMFFVSVSVSTPLHVSLLSLSFQNAFDLPRSLRLRRSFPKPARAGSLLPSAPGALRWRGALSSAMAGSGSDPRCPESFVKRAAALRAKYHVPHCTGALEWVSTPDAVAAHPANRNGVCTNGQLSEEFFLQVFRKFDYAEACLPRCSLYR